MKARVEVDFKSVLKKRREIVWQEIKKYLDSLNNFPDFCGLSPRYRSLARFHQGLVSEYPKRKGKYFRPSLVLLAASAMGFPERKAIKTAAAMQVSEDWILGHDDFEDQSQERRGQPALHCLCGNELAVNAGDALHVVMWEILKDNQKVIGQKKTMAILAEFCQMLKRTTLGQTVEIKWTLENKPDLTDEDIFFILESKTAYYTCAGPMRLGAILAGASQKELGLIYEFGRALGRCFQIKDDLLDLTSDFSGLKKQTGNDIYEGKRTVMLMHLFRQIKGEEKKRLLAIMKKKRNQKTKREVEWVIKMMKKYGSLGHAQKLIGKFQKEAKETFDKKLDFFSCQPARDQLRAAVDFVATRDH